MTKIQVPEKAAKASLITLALEQKNISQVSSIPIASAVTAYARIHMNKFKNLSGNNCYYTDTDSVIMEKPLPSELVSKAIGDMKLEYSPFIKNAYFVSPKLYGFIKENGEPEVKAKGVGPSLNYSQLIELYEGSKVEIKKKVWLKSYRDLNVKIEDRSITLTGEFTKREKVFSPEGLWVEKRPLVVKDGVVLTPAPSGAGPNSSGPSPLGSGPSLSGATGLAGSSSPKALQGEVIITKGPRSPKGSGGAGADSGEAFVGGVSEPEGLCDELNKLDKEIESDKEAIKNSSGILKTVFSTQLMVKTDKRSGVLAKLRKLGVSNPCKWVNPLENEAEIKEAEFKACTEVKCLPAPAKLLALPAPSSAVP